MGSTFGARRYNFDWRSFITPGVKLIVLVCTGVFLVEVLTYLLSPGACAWMLKWFGLIPAAVTRLLPPRIWQPLDRKSTRLNSSHVSISYAVFCLKKKKIN